MKMPRLIASTARLPHIAPSQPDKAKPATGKNASILLPMGTIAPAVTCETPEAVLQADDDKIRNCPANGRDFYYSLTHCRHGKVQHAFRRSLTIFPAELALLGRWAIVPKQWANPSFLTVR